MDPTQHRQLGARSRQGWGVRFVQPPRLEEIIDIHAFPVEELPLSLGRFCRLAFLRLSRLLPVFALPLHPVYVSPICALERMIRRVSELLCQRFNRLALILAPSTSGLDTLFCPGPTFSPATLVGLAPNNYTSCQRRSLFLCAA